MTQIHARANSLVVLREDSQALIVERVSRALEGGAVVALPTETVYGFACDARNEDALAQLFELKGRPANVPLPVALAEPVWAKGWQAHPDKRLERLAQRWWPGPLTIVVPARSDISPVLSAGLGTVALRVPDQELTRAIIHRFGRAVALTSANQHGDPPALSADEVRANFPRGLAAIVDGGVSALGIPSTLVLLEEGDAWRVLRPGGVAEEDLAEVLGP